MEDSSTLGHTVYFWDVDRHGVIKSEMALRVKQSDRRFRHRLLPRLALRTPNDAIKFINDLGVVVQNPDPYLPSIFAAAQGRAAKPGTSGFGSWPEHAWWWPGEISKHSNIIVVKILMGKRTFVAQSCWADLDAAVRGCLSSLRGPEEALVASLIRSKGTISSSRLLEAAARKGIPKVACERILKRFERLGMVLVSPHVEDEHRHSKLLESWEHRFPLPLSKSTTIDSFVQRTVWASGRVPERQALTWFPWPKDQVRAAIERLLAHNRLLRDKSHNLLAK